MIKETSECYEIMATSEDKSNYTREFVRNAYRRKKENARYAGIPFTLGIVEFSKILTAKKCRYTGVVLTKRTGRNSSGSNSSPSDVTLDRVDNTMGYITGNVVPCCYAYNTFKGLLENPSNILSFSIVKSAIDIQDELILALRILHEK